MAETTVDFVRWSFRSKLTRAVVEKVITPTWTFEGPIVKAFTKEDTKSFCFWKLTAPSELEESSMKTMSAFTCMHSTKKQYWSTV